VPACRRLGLTWLIVASLIALAPVALAGPPDPTWLPGVWDDADHDNVVILGTSGGGIADTCWPSQPGLLLVVLGWADDLATGFLTTSSLPSDSPRAPPAG
jgi:hypothetical protein